MRSFCWVLLELGRGTETILLDLVQAKAEAAESDPDGHIRRVLHLVGPLLLLPLHHLLLGQAGFNVGVESLAAVSASELLLFLTLLRRGRTGW